MTISTVSLLIILVAYPCIVCVHAWTQPAFAIRSIQGPSRLLLAKSAELAPSSSIPVQLSTGGVEEVKFYRIAEVSGDIGKYRVKADLPPQAMVEFLNEYIKEMNQRNIRVPGFRPGKLPPAAMADVKRYIASYAVEVTITALCNDHKLEVCDEKYSALTLDDDTFQQIVLPDAQGRDYLGQRDAWKEGNGFSFVAEFFASKSTYEAEATNDDVQQGEVLAKKLEDNGVLKIDDIVRSAEGKTGGDGPKKTKKAKK
eukprot:gene34232-41437_t